MAQAKSKLDEMNGNGQGDKADKSGTLALTFLESLMTTLSMIYGTVDQGPEACAASDYRLVVSTWKEQPAQRPRCCCSGLSTCLIWQHNSISPHPYCYITFLGLPSTCHFTALSVL